MERENNLSALGRWMSSVHEAVRQAFDSLSANRLRSFLAISGVIIGIVTVVLVASILSNLRDQVALLFRELGTDNVFAFHLTGDPYAEASEAELNRRPLKASYARRLESMADAVREVGVQLQIPPVVSGRPLVARAGGNESETVLVEGVSANYFAVVGAEFRAGRPFTELEDRAGARVAVVGPNVARALFGEGVTVGRKLTLAGESYVVVGELARRRGGFFGENRQDNVLAIPLGAATRRFSGADRVVLYIRAQPGRRDEAFEQSRLVLRRLRELRPDQQDDFTLSTSESIIRTFDELSARIGLATFALAGISLVIGGIGIANVMLIAVTERTREVGLRLALGARRRWVLVQFLVEAAVLSGIGGVLGVGLSVAVGLLLKLVLQGFSAVPPDWAVLAGVAASLGVGMIAGLWPARRAAALDPVEALRHE